MSALCLAARPTPASTKMADTSVAAGMIPGLDGDLPQQRSSLPDSLNGTARSQPTNHESHQVSVCVCVLG